MDGSSVMAQGGVAKSTGVGLVGYDILTHG